MAQWGKPWLIHTQQPVAGFAWRLGPQCRQALITNTTCETLADGTCVIMANNVDCPWVSLKASRTCCILTCIGQWAWSVKAQGTPLPPLSTCALCVCADRKYQVIFFNFSALSIDLWLAAARRTYMAAVFPTAPLTRPPTPLPWLVLCVQNKKEKPSERCLTEILRLRLSSAPPLCWCCPSSFCWQLP